MTEETRHPISQAEARRREHVASKFSERVRQMERSRVFPNVVESIDDMERRIAEEAAPPVHACPHCQCDTRAQKIERLCKEVDFAVTTDKIMPSQVVQSIWNDAFLTNVIVSFLEHLENHAADRHAEFDQAQADASAAGMVEPARHHQLEAEKADSQLQALVTVQEILKEWRG